MLKPQELTPRRIVQELDKYIVGQDKAKRSVAIALRNRFRRQRLPGNLKEEILPKNILMIGPTGVGKTEIARRLARLVNAPFIKVEATKFTEVGYVGRDVDSMIRDLVETAIRMVKSAKMEMVTGKARELAEIRLLDIIAPLPKKETRSKNPFEALLKGTSFHSGEDDESFNERLEEARRYREITKRELVEGNLEDQMIEIEIENKGVPFVEVFDGAGFQELGFDFNDVLGGILPKKKKRRKMNISNARQILEQEEAQKLIDEDAANAEAITLSEQMGIIFIDEMDKIAGREQTHGPDVSREGVQRDILPIVEGSTVMTKYGPVKTDHILFMAAGAFHVSKPSDLIPELQGRFPIRVELDPLGKEEFKRILTEPQTALIKQYQALLATEGLQVDFTPDAIDEVAEIAWRVNEGTENIGARRLHTILEKVLEDLSFESPDLNIAQFTVDKSYVKGKLQNIIQDTDLSRYIL